MRRFHRAVATLLMLTCAFAGSVDGCFVICVEADGHTSLELVDAGCCAGGGERRAQRPDRADATVGARARVADDSTDPCARCIDLPLISGDGAKQGTHRLVVSDRTPPPMPSPADPKVDVPWTDRNRSFDDVDVPDVFLEQQRTIVFRC